MFTKLNDTNKAIIFTVLVLFIALIAGLILNLLNVTSEFLGAGLYAFTPALATLLMLLVVTPEGFSREGWKSLGLHRLGLRAWWIALLFPFAVGIVAAALVWAAWHLPLIFLTSLYHSNGNRLVVLPLCVGTLVAASFFIGYFRLWTGSVWPAAIAHSTHNAAWGALGGAHVDP